MNSRLGTLDMRKLWTRYEDEHIGRVGGRMSNCIVPAVGLVTNFIEGGCPGKPI